MQNEQFHRGVCSKFVYTLGTIFVFMVTNIHIVTSTNKHIDR